MVKKLLFFFLAAWCGGGCLLSVSDPAAERAAETYREMHLILPDEGVNLRSALAQVDAVYAGEVRIAFAALAWTAGKNDRDSLLQQEQARIKLNVLLGYLPGDQVKYDLVGAWECPIELPTAVQVEKAALILDSRGNVLRKLESIRLAHVEALAASLKYGGKSPEYLTAVLHLAKVSGLEFRELYDLTEYEQRFDAAWKRLEKVRKNGK